MTARNIKLPAGEWDRLDRDAAARGITTAALVRRILAAAQDTDQQP